MKKILHKIKSLFVPTESNNHVPLVLKDKATYAFLVIAFVLLTPIVYFQASHLASVISPGPFSEDKVVELLNETRSESGLSTLEVSEELSKAAEEKLKHMADNSYFSHFGPEGTSPWYFIKGAGYQYNAAGENLAVDFANARSVHNALMSSQTHRANILSDFYSEIGIAVATADYQGRKAVYVVQMFGDPVSSPSQPSGGDRVALADNDNSEEPVSQTEEPDTDSQEDREDQNGLVESITESNGTSSDQSTDDNEAETNEDSVQEAEEPQETDTLEEETASTSVVVESGVPFSIGSLFSSYINSKKATAATSLIVIGIILMSLVFLATREHSVSPKVIARSMIIMIVFGFLLFQSYNPVFASKITPVAKSNIVNEYIIGE